MTDFWDQFEQIDEINPQNSSVRSATDENSSLPSYAPAHADFWGQFPQATEQDNINNNLGPNYVFREGATISAAPKRNLLTDFRDCLKWVNNTRIAAYQEGKEQAETGTLEIKDMFGKITPQEKQRLDYLNQKGNKDYKDYGINEPHNYYKKEFDSIIPRTSVGLKKAYVETIKLLPYMWETIKAGGIGSGVGATIGAGVGAARSAITTKADIVPSALQGAQVGGAWGGRITGAMKIAELEAGLARNELKQINEEIKEKGGEPLSIAEINTLSLSVGAVNAGLEMVSLKQMLKTVPGGDKIIEYLEKKNLRELAVNKTVREQLRGVLGQYGKSVFTEMSTEMLQETSNIIADEMARKLGGIDNTPLEQNVARVIDTGKATFGATVFLGGASSTAKVATIMTKQGMAQGQAQATAEKMSTQEKEEFIASNLDTLFKTAQDAPSVQEVQERANLKNKYYTQLKNIGKADDEALQTASIFSEIIANSANEWKVSLDEAEKKFAITLENMSDDEAIKQWRMDNKEKLNNKIIFDSIKNIDEKLDQVYSEFENLPEDFNDVEKINKYIDAMQVLEEIKTGIISDENQQKVQALLQDYEQNDPVITQAIKTVMQNQAIIRNQSINIDAKPKFQSIETAGAKKNQTAVAKKEWEKKGTESKYFKKWFGDSKVVDKKGKPLVVYHGTNANFNKFEIGDIGYHFGNLEQANERMTDFTDGNPHIMSVYLKMENPLDIVSDVGDWLDVDTVKEYLHEYEVLSDEEFKNVNTLSQITLLLQEKGYDGVVYENQFEGKGKSYIVFNSSQIKSIDNIGTFDAKNPNIYYQRRIRESEGQLKLFQDTMQLSLFQQESIFKNENEGGQNVQTEIKENYTQEDLTLKQTETNNITDVGDSLLGNLKKNKKQYSWDELTKMNDLLRQKYLSKSYVYQLPSFEEFKKDGLSNKCIAFIQNVYSKINAKPAKGYDKIEDQKIYYDAIHDIMEKTIQFTKENQKTIDEHTLANGVNSELFKTIFPDKDNKNAYNIFRAYPEYNKQAIIAGGNKLVGALYLDYSTEKNLKKIVEKFENTKEEKAENKETPTGWKKYFDIAQSYRGWFIADKKSGMVLSSRDLPSFEIAQQLAEKMYEYVVKNTKNFDVNFSNLRNYIPRRKDNQNVNPEALIEVFGFRGINFGNWTKQNERQDFVNLAYDSLHDLAELLNLPPKALSLGGKLGLAFGAQGRSGAAGHFIPAYNEINLTRKSGAGSLAHEWWHALDYYFGDQSKGKDFSGQNALSLREQGFLRDEIYSALNTINEQMKYAPLTQKELEEKKNAYGERIRKGIEYYAKDIKTSFAKSKNVEIINNFIDDIVLQAEKIDIEGDKFDALTKKFNDMLEERRRTFDNLNKFFQLLHSIKKLQKVEEMAKTSTKYTDYYTKAEKLNSIEKGHGKSYWTESTELGARAFASYILDKMNQKGIENGFLVRDEAQEYSFDLSIIAEIFNAKLQSQETNKDVKNSIIEWYPANPEERERIFNAFDNLFNRVKTRNENENTILFQSAYHGTPHKFENFSTENIGTGEGAQVHGWGLYFAQDKNISDKRYRDRLATHPTTYDGIDYGKSSDELLRNQDKNGIDEEKYYLSMSKESTIASVAAALKYGKGKEEEIDKILEREIKNAEKSLKEDIEAKRTKYIKPNKEYLNWLKNFDYTKIKIDEGGQLFKVDIPEDNVLLDEDKHLQEQPKEVKNAIYEINKEYNNELLAFGNDLSGQGLYYTLQRLTGSSKAASLKLNEYGIKGITYEGAQDGRCYVIFDDAAVKVLETYYQGENTNGELEENIKDARGFTYQRFNFDGTVKDNLIALLNNKADKSTLIHEFAHVYLTTLNNMARENEHAKAMLLTVNKWLRYDGYEYTTAQHEKFANGFTAYVKSGKAPTYGLKRAFENFRKWLNDLYGTLTNSEEITLDSETEKVFDELLGGAARDAQAHEVTRIVERARDNANLRFRDEAQKTEIKQDQLTDRQRRYRDTAYDILFYALTASPEGKNFIKNKKQLVMILGGGETKSKSIIAQREKIEFIIGNLADELSSNDGILPEWMEFFDIPRFEDGGYDAELARDAFDVIVEKKYLKEDDKYAFLSEEEVQKNEYELDYILEEYKYAKDKTIPMRAYYEWLEMVNPYVREDFEKKWETETNEIDRYEALSKFEQAKEDLKIYAATLKGHGDYSTQFAEYAMQILKRLDFMTERDKEKIFSKLREYNSFREIEANLDYVMDYAETLAAVTERKQIADDIEREVRQTVHEWKNGIKRTKYTYPANKLFARLREINRMKREQIEYLYDSMVNVEHEITYEADAVNNEDYYEVIEKMFIEFKYNNSYYNSTEFLKDLLDKIQGAKFSAKLARDEIDFERRMQQINLIDECARAVDTHKGKVSKIEKAYRHAFNLNSALEMMFNREVKNKFSLDYLYALKDGKVGADRNEVLEKLARVFGYEGKFRNIQLFNKFIDMTKSEFEIKQRYTPDKVNGTYRVTHTDKETGKTFTDRVINMFNPREHKEWDPEPIKLSRMEVIYYYIQAKNPISYKMLTDMGDENTPPKGQFDKHEFDELLENLTPQEQLMGDILQMAAEKYYPELNKYHIKKYHTDLGKAICYFPRKSETQDVKMLEMFNDYASMNTNQKFQKQRTAGPGIRIAPANPLAVLFDHIEKSNTLIVMGEQLDLMNSVFKNVDLKNKIKAVWGEETMQDFMQQITSNLYSGQMSTLSTAEAGISAVMNNIIKAQIFLKPQVGLKQTLSFMNYGIGDEYVTAAEWMKKFAKQTFTPGEWKNNIKYMMNIPYLKDRFSRGGSTDALKRQLEQRLFAKVSLFDEILSANVRYGDIGAIILGGKPYIDCLKDNGYSEDQAIKIFIEKTVNDQQSSIPSTLSNIQRNAAKQPLAKMFFAYQNTPWQYFRTACNAIIKFKQNPNKQTGLSMIKLTSIYLFVFPLMFNMASSLSPISAAGGDSEDLKADFWKSIIGGITFIPLAGMFINSIASGFRGEKAQNGNWFDSAAGKFGNVSRHISKGELTILDIFQAAALLGEATTGLPLTTAGIEAAGTIDMITGSPAKGLIKMGGYTDYRAKKVTGQE